MIPTYTSDSATVSMHVAGGEAGHVGHRVAARRTAAAAAATNDPASSGLPRSEVSLRKARRGVAAVMPLPAWRRSGEGTGPRRSARRGVRIRTQPARLRCEEANSGLPGNAFDRLYRARTAGCTSPRSPTTSGTPCATCPAQGGRLRSGGGPRRRTVGSAREQARHRLGGAAPRGGRQRPGLLTVDEAMEDEAGRPRGLSIVRELPDGRRIRTVAPARRLSLTPAVGRRPGQAAGRQWVGGPGARRSGHGVPALVDRRVVTLELPTGIEMVGRFRPAETAVRGTEPRVG